MTLWFTSAPKRRRYLVGVSGGADSIGLLHLLVEHGFSNLVVCHLDHRLRGRASTGDARFVEKTAAKLGLPFELGRTEVGALSRANGCSLETAGREARHAFFADCAKKHRCPRVLLAHHADDRAETALWNLLRGSHGVKSIRPAQTIRANGRSLELIRPLLGVRRSDLRDFLTQRGLAWREDATNAEGIAIRNRLRLEALPLLEDIAGRDIVPALLRAADASLEQEAITAWALDRANVRDPQGRLHLPALRALPEALQRAAIHRYLSEHGIAGLDRDLLDRALALLDPTNPAVLNLPGNRHLRRRAGRMEVT
ncbi:MAG TPA: tRNA lysidine(34) synthetase TilS [Luteolibacter sp.]